MKGSVAHSDQLQQGHHGLDLRSEHEDRGLSDATWRVHMIKPSGVHIRHTCTGKVYREYKHICKEMRQ